ncbi:hypothetical protein BGX30_008136 [Mortierella sp. GBA39]|nr:hypothetical protein BGX30_008136 [Mortierella sp. GBA39]
MRHLQDPPEHDTDTVDASPFGELVTETDSSLLANEFSQPSLSGPFTDPQSKYAATNIRKQRALVEGKFTDEYKAVAAALRQKDGDRKMMTSAIRATTAATTTAKGRKGRTWKSDGFKRFRGVKAIQASVRNIEAGGYSKALLAKICLNKGIQIGD